LPSAPAVAWKTGTSWGFRNAWSVGVVGRHVLAVWIGNFDGSGNPAFIGVKAAAPLFFQIVDSLREQGLDRGAPVRSPPAGPGRGGRRGCAPDHVTPAGRGVHAANLQAGRHGSPRHVLRLRGPPVLVREPWPSRRDQLRGEPHMESARGRALHAPRRGRGRPFGRARGERRVRPVTRGEITARGRPGAPRRWRGTPASRRGSAPSPSRGCRRGPRARSRSGRSARPGSW